MFSLPTRVPQRGVSSFFGLDLHIAGLVAFSPIQDVPVCSGPSHPHQFSNKCKIWRFVANPPRTQVGIWTIKSAVLFGWPFEYGLKKTRSPV